MSLLLEGGGGSDSEAQLLELASLGCPVPSAPACALATPPHQFLGARRLHNVGASQPHHLLTVGPGTGDLTSLSLGFPTRPVCYLGALGSDIETK